MSHDITSEPRVDEMRGALIKIGIDAKKTSAFKLLIREVSSTVGDITIELTSDEWVFRIGRHFHQHFAAAASTTPQAAGLIQTVADFVNNRSLLTIRYSGTHPVTARLKNLETGESSIVALPSKQRRWWSFFLSPFVDRRESTRSFRWSGPVAESDASASEEGDDASLLAAKIAELSPEQAKQLAEYLSQRTQ